MAMNARKFVATLAKVPLVFVALVQVTSANTYVVGDNTGWDTPTFGTSPYATWAAQHTFRVGDNIVFNFASGSHTVAEVNSDSYNNCNSGNTYNLQSQSPATFQLTSPGTKYFICTVHCSQGMKFSLNVQSTGNNNNNGNNGNNGNNFTPPGAFFFAPPPPFRFNSAPTNAASFLIVFLIIFLSCFLY